MPISRVTHRLTHTCLCKVSQLSLVVPLTHIYRALTGSPVPNASANGQLIPNQSRLLSHNRSLCDNHDRVSSLSNRTFWLTSQVSYTYIELFGSHLGYLTHMFQVFHLWGLTTPFLLRPTHINYISLYDLNYESFIGRRPKYELTTHSSTLMMDDLTHAHTPMSRDDRAYEMQSCNFMPCHDTYNIYKFRIIIFPTHNFH